MMSGIRGKNTRPELAVRRYLHSQGLRYRLHDRGLPGHPDLVFARLRLALFVNGCFWHQHTGCRFAAVPRSNVDFWTRKLRANVDRDRSVHAALERLGWTTMIVWECELDHLELLPARIRGSGQSGLRPTDGPLRARPNNTGPVHSRGDAAVLRTLGGM